MIALLKKIPLEIKKIPTCNYAAYRLWCDNPSLWRYAPLYLNSFRTPYLAVYTEIPIITLGAIHFLDHYLKPDHQVLEWGSGGSTSFISRRCGHLTFIENDPDYFQLVSKHLAKLGFSHVEGLCITSADGDCPPPLPKYPWVNYQSTLTRFAGQNFSEYAHAIDRYPDHSFDLILVDGRARQSCLIHAISKVKIGGYLMLDDATRYSDAVNFMDQHFKGQHFKGSRPYHTDLRKPNAKTTQTSVWQIDRHIEL